MIVQNEENKVFLIKEICEDCGECYKVLAVTMTAAGAYAARADYARLDPSADYEVEEVAAKPGAWRPEAYLQIYTNLSIQGEIDPKTDAELHRRVRTQIVHVAAESDDIYHEVDSKIWAERVQVTTYAPESAEETAIVEHRAAVRRLASSLAADPELYRHLGRGRYTAGTASAEAKKENS